MNNNKRDIGIDVIKCIAALLITNSHFDLLYPYKFLATGGSIGNSLFFFASGFLLFLKPMGRFDNWYKKRINRIYPTIFAWAILCTLFLGEDENIIYLILYSGEWFISCIMIYYVIIYFINKFMRNNLMLSWGISLLIFIVWYIIIDKPSDYDMYGITYFKYGFYFLFMLMGAIMGASKKQLIYNFKSDFLKLIGCCVLYYLIAIGAKKFEIINILQMLSLAPLIGLTYYFYKVANGSVLKKVYQNNIGGAFIKIIGGLCLEIYLVQVSLFTDRFNNYFPLNIIGTFLAILIAAYILRCSSRLFSQIFKEQDLDWKGIISLY
ncbi:acyltransferase family protein [Maribacter sp. IgM3_T14_3]|uniref:acyltransferase family protein n=1 Tax=Maribacter sp. IgM3_T14_3 TaxID=3415140 RepID=UPI003C6FFCF7